jgi:hypothetical protein
MSTVFTLVAVLVLALVANNWRIELNSWRLERRNAQRAQG